MHKTTKRIYLENDNYQLVSLDFGNKSFSMVIVLPQPSKTIAEILPSIDWNTSNVSHEVDIILSLPKIKLETLTELNEILQGMGMESLYENNSLSNISNDLSLSWAQQNTCFEIDESGVKASSVTSANGMESSSGSIYEMVVNRPFLFAIRENSTNTLMFMGKIAKIE
jgi:serpin B